MTRDAHDSLSCKHSDRDIPKLECGYPLPCPWHTVVIDVSEQPHRVMIPLANKMALANSQTLIDIGKAFVVPKKARGRK